MPNKSVSIAVIIPAAGFGKRLGGDTAKAFVKINNKTILAHTVDKIKLWAERYQHEVSIMVGLSEGSELPFDVSAVKTCVGGKERADTVANAIEALSEMDYFDWIMVHDAARPLVSVCDIERLYQTLKNDKVGGLLAEKVTATVKRASDNIVIETVSRDELWLAQTPQLFRFSLLEKSLNGKRGALTDEASGIEAMGLEVKIVAGSRENIKITTAADLHYFQCKLGE